MKKNFSLFVVGDKAILADEVKGILQIDNPTASFFAQKGSIEEWVKAANIILFYPAVRFKAYTAFVPTLIRILDCATYILDNNVSTGKLKTVSNWLVASMWGDPIKLQAGANSTQVGIMKLVEYCTDIPTFVDETSQAPEHIKKLIYWVANGNSRLKGTSDGGLVIPPSHATVIIATGEDPIVPENAHGGEDVRVLPLKEGVSDILPTDIVNDMEIGLKNNYGHIAVRFIQELLKEKKNIPDIYKAYFREFPEVPDITSNRAKKNYAITATAGYLLERVFEEIGIDPMNPYEICNRYFEQNVLEDSFTPDYIKVLNATYSFFTTNEVHFGRGDEDSEEGEIETNNEKYGWIRGKDNELICFNENALKKHITATLGPHRYESATKIWKDLKILNTRQIKDKDTDRIKVLKTVQIRVHDRKVTVLQIPLENFYKHLNIGEQNQSTESENKRDNSSKPDIETSSVGSKVITSSYDFEKITDTTNNDIIELDDDAELAEIMKQEGIL